MAAVFIAQATNTPMTLTQQLTLLAVLLLTSKGAAGVTGSGFIVLAATLSAVGHVPVGGLALILGIDRFMSEARALTNLIGNGVATVVVGKWCGELDVDRMNRVLNNETTAEGGRAGSGARHRRDAHAGRQIGVTVGAMDAPAARRTPAPRRRRRRRRRRSRARDAPGRQARQAQPRRTSR